MSKTKNQILHTLVFSYVCSLLVNEEYISSQLSLGKAYFNQQASKCFSQCKSHHVAGWST